MSEPTTSERSASRGLPVAAVAAAVFVFLAPALYGVIASSGADGVPAIAALVFAGIGAGLLALIGAVVAYLGMVVGYRSWAVVGVLIGSLLLWWMLVIASPVLGQIYQNVGEPGPDDCQNVPTGQGCL
jgi:hypothetical protein